MKLLCLRYVKCDLISHTRLMRSKRLLAVSTARERPLPLSNSHSANSAKWRRRITYRFAIRKNWSKSIYQICWSELWRNISESSVYNCKYFRRKGDLPASVWDIFVFFLKIFTLLLLLLFTFYITGIKSP